jgi:hypothetical protein
VDRLRREPDRDELAVRDDAALTAGERGDRTIPGALIPHTGG